MADRGHDGVLFGDVSPPVNAERLTYRTFADMASREFGQKSGSTVVPDGS
ncbi:hypothetical protein LN996_20630 [Arthrobacter sp. AK01]|nr:hypothetical protein [Arthrobacter sp. AK01]MCD4853232.1 hypothetical protein [Arthrobacter sp. AK01]